MANFFSRLFPAKVMYHAELPSRERIVKVLEEELMPVLGPLGFTFNAKDILFQRDRGDFVDTIVNGTKRHKNTMANTLSFGPSFAVRYTPHERWYESSFGQSAKTNVWYARLPDLKGIKPTCLLGPYYDLEFNDNRKLMDAYRYNLLQVVVPIMDRASSIDGILDILGTDLRKASPLHVHMHLMKGDHAGALRAYERYVQSMAENMDYPAVAERLARLKAVVDARSGTSQG
jgi:hypothetical protein